MKIEFNNNYAVATPESKQDQNFLEKLRSDTAILAPGALYLPSHKQYKKTKGKAGWDGKVYSISVHGQFLTGMLPRIVNEMKLAAINVSLHYTGPPRNPGVMKAYNVPLRDYQREGVKAALQNSFNGWWPRGILRIATGGGKTEMAVAMFKALPVKTLFIVHLKTLLHQTVERFDKYDITTGIIGDGQVTIGNTITIATVQSLDYHVKNGTQKVLKLLAEVQQVFFDEAHGIAASVAKGNQLVKLSNMMPNAFMRWGLTATPFMRDEYSNALLEGVTGNVVYNISSDYLIKAGYLSLPEIIMLRTEPVEGCPKSWPGAYDSGIVLNNIRTVALLREVQKSPKPVLIMCSTIGHAKIIYSRCFFYGIHIGYLDGRTPSSERKQVIADLVLGKLDAVVCTTIFNAGVDIPQLRTVVLASGGKSRVSLLQKLGRGLRRSVAKDKVTILDFYDKSAKILEKHSKERLKVWQSEGFEVEIKDA